MGSSSHPAPAAWFHARWEAFRDSYDAPKAAAQSSPAAIVLGVGSIAVGLLVVGYVPAIASVAQLRFAFVPAGVFALGAFCSHVAWRHKATGTVGSACMLLDTLCYSTAFSLAAVLSSGPFSFAFALAEALFLLALPGSVYAINLLIALAMCTPPVVLALAIPPAPGVTAVLWIGCTLGLVTSVRTGQRRALSCQNERLRSALGATSWVADESIDAALGASLLDIGHLLHELRNLQAAQRVNLDYLVEEARLDGPCQAALEDLAAARRQEEKLVLTVLDSIRKRSQGTHSTALLRDVLESSVVDDTLRLSTTLAYDGPSFVLRSNPDHLRIVVQNLIRNASQAGARNVVVRVSASSSTNSVSVDVEDDGPGLPAEMLGEHLFQPFASSRRTGGTGLGLYLTKRYVELMGGRMDGGNREEGGARFRISLPGRIASDGETRDGSLLRGSVQPLPAATGGGAGA